MQGAATIDRLRDEIQGVRYREATTTFCRLVTQEALSLKDTIKKAIASTAPYVQVSSYLMQLPSGEFTSRTGAQTLGNRPARGSRRSRSSESAVEGLPSVRFRLASAPKWR